MKSIAKDKLVFFLVGLVLGIGVAVFSWNGLRKMAQRIKDFDFAQAGMNARLFMKERTQRKGSVIENFSRPLKAVSGKSFGKDGRLTFELFRGGTFLMEGTSGYAWQKSDSYGDSAFIRSTQPLPKTYKVSVVIGDIDYGLDKIRGLERDPEYAEGPLNENGCYLLAITDTAPVGHHTNAWWHQHRKVAIDVDNNVWGHGMPDPIFMVYFDKDNQLVSYDGMENEWRKEWVKAMTYEPRAWYRIEIEKTQKEYILNVWSQDGGLLKSVSVDFENVWHADEYHGDYFVVGDPHENYYQGSMKIKEISLRP